MIVTDPDESEFVPKLWLGVDEIGVVVVGVVVLGAGVVVDVVVVVGVVVVVEDCVAQKWIFDNPNW